RTVGGVRRLAAERLGISERTLRYKLARWREAGEIDLATLAGERHGEDA
ncbi:MAG: helix-turn-helix domain-containing protein, partial [Laribacter sp.]|nr:helix-turn-helix domain-containing protein [Laribacter sp.]